MISRSRAADPVERLPGPWHVRGDGDDLPLGQPEREPDPPRRERERGEAAEGSKCLARHRFLARLQGQQFGPDGREPFHRVGHVDGEISQYGRDLVFVYASRGGPDIYRDQGPDQVRSGLFAAGEQERPEAAADRG